MKTMDEVTAVLIIIGGLNWGLVGAFDFNLVAALFGEMSVLARLTYLLVGVAALYQALAWPAIRRRRHAVATHPEAGTP